MIIHSEGYRFRRGTGSPFDAIQPMDLGSSHGVPCQWCAKCNQSVDVAVVSYNQNQVWGQKHTCKRCGSVTLSAVYYHVQKLGQAPTSLLMNAQEWATTPESLTK